MIESDWAVQQRINAALLRVSKELTDRVVAQHQQITRLWFFLMVTNFVMAIAVILL